MVTITTLLAMSRGAVIAIAIAIAIPTLIVVLRMMAAKQKKP